MAKNFKAHTVAAAAKEEEMRVWQIAWKCWSVASENVIVLSVSD